MNLHSYRRKSLVNYKDTSKRLEMHIFKDPFIMDARFEIEYQVPADVETFKFFQQQTSRK